MHTLVLNVIQARGKLLLCIGQGLPWGLKHGVGVACDINNTEELQDNTRDQATTTHQPIPEAAPWGMRK